MNQENLTLVVIGKDQASLDAYDTSHVSCDLRLIANPSNRSLSSIANEELKTSAAIFGLVHADTIFRAGALDVFTMTAGIGSVCGIVGRTLAGEYRWCFKEPGFADGVVRGPGPVCTLDGCSVFFRTNLGLQFDETLFDSFHCHVEDLCMAATSKDIPVVVPFADATHASDFPSAEWAAAYRVYRDRLMRKWAGYQVVTT